MSSRYLIKIIVITLFLLFFYQNAFSYLDLGTGSYILQVTLGILLGAAFSIKLFWNKVKDFFARFFPEKVKDEGTTKDEES